MANIEVQIAKNNPSDNTDVASYIEIIQGGNVILGCFSTEVNSSSANPLRMGLSSSFNQSLSTTVNYYNLGKKVNNINITGVNFDGFGIFSSGNPACGSGEMKSITFEPQSGQYGLLLKVNCNETSQTLSGVDFQATGTQVGGAYPSIGSVKPSDSGWVSRLTPNNSRNPYYVAGTGGGVLTAPTVSETARLNTQTVVFAGMQFRDTLTLWVNDFTEVAVGNLLPGGGNVPQNGELEVSLTSFGGMSMQGRYLRGGVTSPNSQAITVTTDPNTPTKLPDLTFTSVSGKINYYVGESVDITGFSSGASLSVKIGTSNAVLDTDYSLSSITGGYHLTFLTAKTFKIRQTKSGFTSSTETVVTVPQTRPVLTVPIPSKSEILLNDTVTITNAGSVSYSNINVYRDTILVSERTGGAASAGDYTLLLGAYTLLKLGSYTFVGQKADYADSEASNPVVVSNTPVTLHLMDYDLGTFEACSVAPANIEFGSSAMNDIDTVTDWTSSKKITKDLSLVADSNFFWIRDKDNHSVVSPVFEQL
jgi:archaellum component FlaF (FlaF/FlaG flagellin family)